jgi:hypothetical protein
MVERGAAPARPLGDLVQSGPLLVVDGTIVFDADDDGEGFSIGAGEFDSDITDGRHPRAALGVSNGSLVAVACDGRRSNVDGGLSMLELAEAMVELGAESAINLHGGGSTTLVHRGHLLNRPYSTQDQPAPASRRIVSALAFEPQGAGSSSARRPSATTSPASLRSSKSRTARKPASSPVPPGSATPTDS